MSKLTYKDFLAETLSDKPSQLFLSGTDGVTDFYLDVLGEKNPALKRAIIDYSLKEQDVYKSASDIKDRVERVIYVQDSLIPIRKELALNMVTGGNFEDHLMVLDNPINCDAVIARSYDASNYAVKK
ncbi:hypothetical protein N9878_02330 [bacterium]|nr:hypothetical protein [bacterium]